ncbi:MAG TPA: DUF1622 domain-containing protein [Edaphobacter sp.]|jgi:uncharacterized membrane protein|nr:DUF1622 domain-containing protein [Edaphobacter sp.]
MEELFKSVASTTALIVEAAAALIIAYGAVQALFGSTVAVVGKHTVGKRKEVWLSFGMWLLLGLEFELAADIIRTAIAPTWTDIGQLGAIAVIRTFLNYFLEKDLEKYEASTGQAPNSESGV